MQWERADENVKYLEYYLKISTQNYGANQIKTVLTNIW